jgi:hypothetical protein
LLFLPPYVVSHPKFLGDMYSQQVTWLVPWLWSSFIHRKNIYWILHIIHSPLSVVSHHLLHKCLRLFNWTMSLKKFGNKIVAQRIACIIMRCMHLCLMNFGKNCLLLPLTIDIQCHRGMVTNNSFCFWVSTLPRTRCFQGYRLSVREHIMKFVWVITMSKSCPWVVGHQHGHYWQIFPTPWRSM